ncbi:hypothetical protein [Oricola cellulosilytica]|uniref:Uncharacterized protein n=1 Tax=Oricola cellulosilytica TaxID=1429082 RepID=A0A4R0P8F6_9HYPH|nr:hypothetical protein [Oricola cellulosilytica]TCD12276.1 hypothetical protein E0D97_14725 [Oricola cellulosilytica]
MRLVYLKPVTETAEDAGMRGYAFCGLVSEDIGVSMRLEQGGWRFRCVPDTSASDDDPDRFFDAAFDVDRRVKPEDIR